MNNAKKQNEIENKCVERLKKNISIANSYGLSLEDYSEFELLIDKITPNKNSNDFPDFILDEGFVEHFVITSSNEGKKGASHKISEFKHMEKNKRIAKNLSSHKQIVSNTMIYEGHSYLNLENSFKKNWDKHIQSLKKFKGEQKVGIFLIEYLDHMALSMAELSLNGVNEICIGDIKRQEMVNDYRLSRDKDMLDWISTFEKEIEYVVFMSQEHVEIIKLSGISKLQTVLPYKYAIAPNITQRTDRWVQIGKISNKDE